MKNKILIRKQLAQELKLSYSTISKYETGIREPDFKTLIAIAEYFNVSVDYLIGRINELEEFSLEKTLAGFNDEMKQEIIDYISFLKQKNTKK